KLNLELNRSKHPPALLYFRQFLLNSSVPQYAPNKQVLLSLLLSVPFPRLLSHQHSTGLNLGTPVLCLLFGLDGLTSISMFLHLNTDLPENNGLPYRNDFVKYALSLSRLPSYRTSYKYWKQLNHGLHFPYMESIYDKIYRLFAYSG